MVIGFMGGLIAVGVMSLLIVLFVPPPTYRSALQVEELTLPDVMDVCPGDTLSYSIKYRIRRPTVTSAHVSYHEAHTGLTVRSVPATVAETSHPEPATLYRNVPFVIPDLPPGEFERVTAITSKAEDAQPVFIVIPFLVTEGCP